MTGQGMLRGLLVAASVNNIAGGLALMLWPVLPFRMAGLPAPLYPELVQSFGLLIAVFGFGYALASFDPLRHWPMVLSGLTGKVLGSVGFVHAAQSGRVPWSAWWAILIADVVWWIPFGIILKRAWEVHTGTERSRTPEILPLALRTRTSSGASLEQLSVESPVLVVFLRHAGCTFCREALSDISQQRQELEREGVRIVLVHLGEAAHGREFFARYGLQNVAQIANPSGTLYRAFGLQRGTLRNLLGPVVWWRGFQAAIVNRHGVGPINADPFQMPGIFLVFHGHVLRSYRHLTSADRPDYAAFAREALSQPVP